VREPAALTGSVGLKITHGRWSLDGIVPCSPSLDTPGPLARTVEDCAYGFAALDPAGDLHRMRRALDASTLSGVRIGIAEDHYWQGGDARVAEIVRSALRELESGGARLVPFPLPEARDAQSIFVGGDPCAAELHAFLAAELPEWIDLLNPMLRPQVDAGGRMTASDYLARWAKAARIARAFCARWAEADVIAMPTEANSPPDLDGLAAVPGRRWDDIEMRNTDWASLLKLCAISIPGGLDGSGLPVGLQLVAPAMAEERLLAIAHACERRLGTARERLGTAPLTPDA
jgi:aspartyl-tRNA(Asn)/glutamyl-tRNA(Gln) amidotransferase subunit A